MSFWDDITKKILHKAFSMNIDNQPRIVIINKSTDKSITLEVLQTICNAIQIQLNEHYSLFWRRITYPIVIGVEHDLTEFDFAVSIYDNSEQAGILGYHATYNGKPYGRIFWHTISKNGGTLMVGSDSLSATLSHEVIELINDPYANLWADTGDGSCEDAFEMCDRVEGDSYEINKVSVSNFLGPNAFSGGAAPYDWMRLLSSPWEIRKTGYAIRRTVDGILTTVWGETYQEWKKDVKLKDMQSRKMIRFLNMK